MVCEQAAHQHWVRRGLRPEHDARRAPGEHLRNSLLTAQAAADLHRDTRAREHRAGQLAVIPPAEGAVQVHQMEPARAGAREGGGERERVVGVRGRRRHPPPPRTPGRRGGRGEGGGRNTRHTPALHVHGRVEIHPDDAEANRARRALRQPRPAWPVGHGRVREGWEEREVPARRAVPDAPCRRRSGTAAAPACPRPCPCAAGW